ncbi:gfo/Idh/MocA family oxidoreductase [Sandaracinomonas limnophila]|uniref:Gfo/Idh/MocA family oxidoreductase n=1 Tax=Sandaracinomonas limnophila TaxID=1862386 RepID=A0A437PWF3_9BACT|nr:Gfo/Idh/MocA family oxidoreductase [Sandaracinomonas limnophila]RVU26562.1 gfo/Idh/MocA family oxidoreductase [Sandaracinomonas limnophila]
MNTFNINRRNFLKGASAVMAMQQFGAYGLDLVNPSKPIRVGLIGTGWYGKSDLFRLMQVAPVEVVALCDVDRNMLNQAGKLVAERAKTSKIPLLYGNYQKMLAENQFDIVLVGTPDHWHPLTMIEAVKKGANVYVQKPISVDVLEGEAMVAAARKYGRTVQVGTQRKSTPHIIQAKKDIVDQGLLGKIAHVEMCCYLHMRNNGNPPIQQVPEFLDYEMWCGPAPKRGYDGLPHIRWWRTFMEYGNGITGDMCVHMFDTVRWMLGLGWPKKITAEGGIYVQKDGVSNIADTQTAVFEYENINCVWNHRTWGTPPDPDYPWALFIYGEKGTLKLSTMRADFIPVDPKGQKIHLDCVFEREKYPEDNTEERIELNAAPATRLHMLDFLAAIDQNKKPVADIEQGHISTASCIIANLSMKLGRSLVYDPVNKVIKNDPEATALLAREYRAPYSREKLKV